MASPRTSPLPKAPLVVSAGVALLVATTAIGCGDDTGSGGTGGTENQGGNPPGISGGGAPEGGAPGMGGAGGTENAGGAPGLAAGGENAGGAG